MKKFSTIAPALFFLTLNLSGCQAVGQKNASLSLIYGSAANLSLFLLIGCCWFVKQKGSWLILLFTSVLVVNIGYTFLSISSCLEMALWANRVSYLGSVFLPFAMLMIILNITNTQYSKWLPISLGVLAFIIFLIAASPGILPIYYKEVSFAVVNGISTLIKVYGPLHPIYLFYLVGYFVSMIAVIFRAQCTKSIGTTAHAIIVAIAVFVNIGVWFIEQIVSIDFEMLSISYIISELFLLAVHLVMNEYEKMSNLIQQVESVPTHNSEEVISPDQMLAKPVSHESVNPERIELFMSGLQQLTVTEHAIYNAHIARVTTKEIMANFNIKESTLKYHNRNIYGKLGVSSRKELLELHKHISSVKAKLDSATE